MKNHIANRWREIMKSFNWLVCAVALCCGMWGCGIFDEEVTTSINEKRSGGMPIALLDDSLAIVYSSRGWEEHAKSCDYYSSCDYGAMNQGVFLVNYRKKRAPYWGDTTKGVLYIAKGLAYDSTVIFYKDDGYFGLWKVGETLDIRKKIEWKDGCAWSDFYTHARPWLNGNVLLKGVYPCPYAVLDTATGVVSKLEFTGEYAWLDGCDDITYIDGDVVCLRQRDGGLCEMDLEKKVFSVDSILKREWMMGKTPYFMGNAARLPVYIWDKEDPAYNFGDRILLLGKNGFKRDYSETWLNSYSFINSFGNSISYSSEDLIVTK